MSCGQRRRENMDDFTQEQHELMNKPKFIIMPAFNNEWVIEVYNQQDEFQGRFNATDNEVLLEALRSEIDGNGDFGLSEN